MEIRHCVRKFSEAMEKKLCANDHKGGWRDCHDDFLWSKLIEEISELHRVLYRKNRSERAILREGADVANVVMMIVDNNTWRSKPLSPYK